LKVLIHSLFSLSSSSFPSLLSLSPGDETQGFDLVRHLNYAP
jgi:hypothetical protein